MKKLLIIFSCILMMFAIVACNQSGPEVKPDAFEEANQAIPSSNVDMNTAKDVTEDQSFVFTEAFAKARTQVMSNSVVGQIINASGSEEGIDWMGILNYILGNGSSKTLDDGSEDANIDTTVKVDIDSMSGTLTLGCGELVLKGSELDENNNPVERVLSDIAVDATLSGTTISITVGGNLDGKRFEITGTVTINTYATGEEDQIVPKFEETDDFIMIKNLVTSEDYSLVSIKDIILDLTNVGANLSVTVKGVATILVDASLNGNVVLSIAMKEDGISSIAVKVNSLNVKVDAGVLGNVSASIKNLSFELVVAGFSTSLSVSEVSISGTLLPSMDNIRFKAGMKGFELDSDRVVAIDTIEATVLGYENISIAAKVEDFRVDTDDVQPSFKFGAAVSFESQTIGIRGEWGKDLDPTDVSTFITIAVLNGAPVEPNSLFELIVRVVLPPTDGDGTTV